VWFYRICSYFQHVLRILRKWLICDVVAQRRSAVTSFDWLIDYWRDTLMPTHWGRVGMSTFSPSPLRSQPSQFHFSYRWTKMPIHWTKDPVSADVSRFDGLSPCAAQKVRTTQWEMATCDGHVNVRCDRRRPH